MQHTWVSDVTRKYEWVMSWFWMSRSSCQMDICMHHGASMNGSCQTCPCVVSQWWMVCVTRMKVMSQKQMTRTTRIHWSLHTRKRHIAPKIESCHIDGWFVSRACNSCQKNKAIVPHVWMGPFTHASVISRWVMSHACVSLVTLVSTQVTYMNESCHAYLEVMTHTWMNHVTHMHESCRIYEWVNHVMSRIWKVMSRIWLSHVTHMTESCHTYEWVMSHIWMNHIPTLQSPSKTARHMNESCHASEESRIWMSHVTHMTESCHTYIWVILRI